MGGSSWSDRSYRSVVEENVKLHDTAFVHDSNIRSGKTAKKVHALLDPKGLTVRESRDSEAHPQSNAILIGLDVTGSMRPVIDAIHKKLPTLMGLLVRKNYIPDPQILFSAIGDATCDTVPLQVGQFESGVEMEGDLSRFFIEGGGGGQMTESYELLAYVGAEKTSIDCMEKRGKKGYCFIIGDEMAYSRVSLTQVEHLIGPLESDIPITKAFDRLRAKYTTFFILPENAQNGGSATVKTFWQNLLGNEHVLLLKDASAVAELIATQIGLCEGSTDFDSAAKDIEEHGGAALVPIVRSAISKTYSGGSVSKVPAGVFHSDEKDTVKRL